MKRKEVIENMEEFLRSARIFYQQNRLDEAIRELHSALELCEDYKVSKEKSKTLSLLANIQHYLGYQEESLKSYKDALSLAEEVSKPDQVAHITSHIADVEREVGSLKEAQSHYQKALEYYRANLGSHSLNRANALRGMALLKEKMVDYSDAKRLWKEAKVLYQKLKIEDGVRECASRLKKLELS